MVLASLLSIASAETGYLMRLKLQPGQVVKYRLAIDRKNPKSSGELLTTFKISKVDGRVMFMDATLTKLKVNGKDRTRDLKAAIGDQVATLPWTELSTRTGRLVGFQMRETAPEVMGYLAESGIYLASFQRNAVKPGDSWPGSTTATGGCTSGRFTLKEVKTVGKRTLAVLEVTGINFLRDDEQTGPMKMVVDLETGLPDTVEYTVKSKMGQISHFKQSRA